MYQVYYLTCACKHAPTQTGVSVKGLDVESDVARDDVERVSHDRVLVGVSPEWLARVVQVRYRIPMNLIQTIEWSVYDVTHCAMSDLPRVAIDITSMGFPRSMEIQWGARRTSAAQAPVRNRKYLYRSFTNIFLNKSRMCFNLNVQIYFSILTCESAGFLPIQT